MNENSAQSNNYPLKLAACVTRYSLHILTILYNYNSNFSAVAGQNVLGVGAQLGRAKPRGTGEKTLKFFDFFIPEIGANASNFKN